MTSQEQPERKELDGYAVTITSIDYYLERLIDDEEGTGTELIQIAQNSVALLGLPVAESAAEEEVPLDAEDSAEDRGLSSTDETILALPEVEEPSEDERFVTELPQVDFSDEPEPEPAVEAPASEVEGSEDLIDDEIIEIFVEEAGEVLAALDEYFPRWVKNQHDEEALIEFRRAFHTLKGSGRMVGAHTVGELAWSIENMMNRVIDKSIEPSDQLIELVRRVHAAVPELVNAFALRQPDPFDVAPLEQAAFRLAEGATDIELPGAEAEDAAATESADEVAAAEEVVATEAEETATEETALEAAVEKPADELPKGVDPVLVDIFRTESYNNLELASQWLNALDRDLSSFILSDKLHRALHTLKGSARMAEVEAVAEIAEPAEQLVKDMISHNEKADYEVVQLLHDVVALLEEATGYAYPHMPRIEGADTLLQRIAAAHEAVREQREQLDQRALTRFLAEGMGL